MATLYWGGGTGTWDGFTITNWYTDFARLTPSTRAPSAEDDVIFDLASNATAYTVTISGNTTVCRNVTIAGPATGNLTLAGTGTWFIYGNLTLPATGFTRTLTSQIQFWGIGSHTITTNGVALASLFSFQGLGTYTLQDALNTSGNLTINGVFNTNDKNLTCATITSSVGGNAGTLTLGASTVSATTILANAPLTINAGTSNITLSAANASIGGGVNYTGNTFNNVTFSSNAVSAVSLRGANTFNNLTFTTLSAAGVSFITLVGNQTVNGTLTITGQSSVNRYVIRSDVVGTTRTLTVATVATLTDVDFRDITAAGASSPWSGTRLGDCGGNTNITFPSAKTVYWNGTTGGAWTGNFWATSSGGAVNVANFPLAQDTAIIDDTGLNTGSSITGFTSYSLKTLTSTKTNAYTLSGTPILYGDLTLTASMTVSGLTVAFQGRVTQNLTSAGNTLAGLTCNGYNASVKLANNTTVNNWTITSGGLDTDNKNFTVNTGATVSTSGGAFSLTLGSSAISIAGNDGVSSSSTSAPTMTVSAGTSTVTLTNAGALFSFAGQTLTWYNVIWSTAVTGPVIYGTNTFNNLTLAAPTATGVSAITVFGNQTVSGTFALAGGTSVTQRLGIYSDIPGTQRTITAATVTGLTDIDFRDIAAAGASAPWSGTRLGNCLGNSGITFASGTNKYWNLAGTQNWSATGWATSSGGTPAANDFPLAQDTAVFDDTGSAGTVTLNAGWNIGTFNASSRTSAMTLAGSGPVIIYGNVTYGSGITSTANGTWVFLGTSTQTFTTAGKTLANGITINNPSCVFQHGDAYTTTGSITVTYGSYITQNYNVSVQNFQSTNSNTRTITFGTSTITCSGINPINFLIPSGLTFSGASSTINLSATASKTFRGGDKTFGTVSSTGGTTNPLTIVGSNTFGTLTNSARTYMSWTAGTTQTITTFSYSGASGSVVRWYTSIPGQRATIQTSSSAVGSNSTDGGNNSGLTFTGSSPDYFYVKDIAYSASSGILVYISESAAANSSETPTGTYNPTISETATGTDSTASNIIVLATIDEASTGSDSISANVAVLVLDGASASEVTQAVAALSSIISEQVQAGENVTATSVINAFIEESAASSDSTARFLSFSVVISESSTASEQASALNVFNSAISEAVASLDAPSVLASTFSAVIIDALMAQDAMDAPGSIYSTGVSESAELGEFIFGSYLWNDITEVSEDYTGIPDTSETWSPITDNSGNWNPV